MRRNRIKLTESQLHQVIKESVKKVLREYEFDHTSTENYGLNPSFSSTSTDPHSMIDNDDDDYAYTVMPHEVRNKEDFDIYHEGIVYITDDMMAAIREAEDDEFQPRNKGNKYFVYELIIPEEYLDSDEEYVPIDCIKSFKCIKRGGEVSDLQNDDKYYGTMGYDWDNLESYEDNYEY